MRSLSPLVYGGLVAIVAVLAVLYWYAIGSPYLISAEEAQQRLKGGQFDVILDVRTTAERETLGFYPHSLHVPGADLEREIPHQYVDKQTRFLIYCNTGQRARAAADKLVAMGYPNVRYIAGTYRGLESSN
jgi:rhodanese-related sulfurtransferase